MKTSITLQKTQGHFKQRITAAQEPLRDSRDTLFRYESPTAKISGFDWSQCVPQTVPTLSQHSRSFAFPLPSRDRFRGSRDTFTSPFHKSVPNVFPDQRVLRDTLCVRDSFSLYPHTNARIRRLIVRNAKPVPNRPNSLAVSESTCPGCDCKILTCLDAPQMALRVSADPYRLTSITDETVAILTRRDTYQYRRQGSRLYFHAHRSCSYATLHSRFDDIRDEQVIVAAEHVCGTPPITRDTLTALVEPEMGRDDGPPHF